MAERKAAEDEFNPRHRIVGAVILVALAVIFLPMLLKDQPPGERAAAMREMTAPEPASSVPMPAPGKPVPPTTDSDTQIVTVPVEPRATRPSSTSEPAPPAPVPEIVAPAPAASKAPPVTTKPAAPAKPSPSSAAATSTATKGKWVVQVGAFSQPDNAKRLYDKLRQKGYTASLDPPRPAKGQTVRVEVGPYRDEASARSAATRIQKDTGIKGVVRQD